MKASRYFLRNFCFFVLVLSLLTLLTVGCGTTDDPTQGGPQQNNHAPKNDVGVQEPDTAPPASRYDALGLPYPLSELPDGVTAPWPDSAITHGALINIRHVIDGDTIRNPFSGQANLRLQGINAPECVKRSTSQGMECDPNNTDYVHDEDKEINEPYGAQAAQALKDLIALNRNVRIVCKMVGGSCETDLYDRYLVWVVIDTPEGPVDASYYLVEQGLALTYTSFPVDNMAAYCTAEDEAIAARRGMWKDGFDAAYSAMHPSTRKWYVYRNDRCRAAQRQ